MKRTFRRILMIAAAATALGGVWLAAQDQPAVIRSQVNLVNLLFSAFDKKGLHVKGLTRSDVEVYEDGLKQKVEFFRFQGDAEADPLTIVFLMDTSASVKDKLAIEQSIAADFMNDILRPTRDLAAVVEFGNEVALIQDFTGDKSRLQQAIHSLKAGGGTALYDGIFLAAEDKLKAEAGRRVILVVSDGEDTASKVKREEAVAAAQRNDATIFAIGIRSRTWVSDFKALEDFCRQTGGRFFDAEVDRRSIAAAFQGILTSHKQQYNVSYYSTNPEKDGSFRKIQIRVRKDNVRVQHRNGYYAPRP